MLADIPKDIQDELADPKYSTRKHYSRATYALGCHGPLCRKAEKDRGRQRNENRTKALGKEYVPGKNRRDDSKMEEIVSWYLSQRKAG